ncbi:MAG: TraB/GumN family protein [Pseudomonadota bacterium]
MLRKFLSKLLILLGLTTAGLAIAQTAPAPAPKPAPTRVATTDADPALWVVKDADTTIYLFGTVHVMKPGLSWFDEGVKAAFDASDELVLEMVQPDTATMQKIVVSKAFSKDGPTLPEQLAPADRAAYLKALTDLGLPTAAFDRAKPWFAATNLSILPLLKLGYDPASGPETVLTTAANAAKKPIEGLETAEQQIGFLSTLPNATQVKFLTATIRDLPKTAQSMDDMVAAWSQGDPAKLGVIMNDGLDESPYLASALLFDRNARWAQWIKTRLDKPGTVFIAVGAGHLAGKLSVIDQLQKLGLSATRVVY